MREVERVLKKGAFCFVTAPFLFRIHGEPFDLHRLTGDRLKEIVSGAGLNLIWLKPQGFYFTVMADFIKSAIAQINVRALRYLIALIALPVIVFLRLIDQLKVIEKSDFFSSFTTGYALLAEKA